MIELGPTGIPGPPMIVPEPGLPRGGRAVGRGGRPLAVPVDVAEEVEEVLLLEEGGDGECGCCCCGGVEPPVVGGGFVDGDAGCCRAK